MSVDLEVEDWPAEHVRLVEAMCMLRPGLRPEQAHVALQALRTMRIRLVREEQLPG